eukprot:8189637-Pyramimonas_sp.AAC.1
MTCSLPSPHLCPTHTPTSAAEWLSMLWQQQLRGNGGAVWRRGWHSRACLLKRSRLMRQSRQDHMCRPGRSLGAAS